MTEATPPVLVKEKDKALNKVVHNQDIELVDKMVAQYKNGATEQERRKAQHQILEYFDSYLEKYAGLFSGATVDLSNYDTKIFLSMFLTGRPKIPSNFSYQRSYIAKVMQRVSKEDIKNDLVALFLNVLQKHYIKEGVNALNPLITIFRFRLKDWFNRMVRDPLFRTVEPGAGDDDSFTNDMFLEINAPVYVDFDKNLTKMTIDWVRNPTEGIFRKFSHYQRYLLYLYFAQELTLMQISETLDRDKDTVKKHLDQILAELAELYEDDELALAE